jgi:hypothetical protein
MSSSIPVSVARAATLSFLSVLASVTLPIATVWAQGAPSLQPGSVIELHLDGARSRIDSVPLTYSYHMLPARTEAAKGVPREGPGPAPPAATVLSGSRSLPLGVFANPQFYPADVSYLGGNVVLSAESINIYVNCGASDSCWGSPAQFLSDLGASKFIHVTDQYVGSRAKNRYTLSPTAFFVQTTLTALTFDDVATGVHQAALVGGAGLTHIYHVFLPQGMDVCADPDHCYTPDNPQTFNM